MIYNVKKYYHVTTFCQSEHQFFLKGMGLASWSVTGEMCSSAKRLILDRWHLTYKNVYLSRHDPLHVLLLLRVAMRIRWHYTYQLWPFLPSPFCLPWHGSVVPIRQNWKQGHIHPYGLQHSWAVFNVLRALTNSVNKFYIIMEMTISIG